MKKSKFELTTPILFLIFNRLDTTKKVFAEIRKAKPKQLFIASDGPRKNKEGEREVVEKVRKYVLSQVDWPCKVKTLFRKENLGCKYAVSGAIDWFFENVEQGIILEDDCLPDQSFFRFCEEMLDKYRDNEKLMMISGQNLIQNKTKNTKEFYLFSKNAFIWGWATWKRAWNKYDVNIHNKITKRQIKNTSRGWMEYMQNKKKIKQLKEDIVRTWDYQWDFIIKLNNGLNIVPKVNLVENIGLIKNTFTNTKPNRFDFKFLHQKRNNMRFPLIHPKKIEANKKFDKTISLLNIKRIILKRIWKR